MRSEEHVARVTTILIRNKNLATLTGVLGRKETAGALTPDKDFKACDKDHNTHTSIGNIETSATALETSTGIVLRKQLPATLAHEKISLLRP